MNAVPGDQITIDVVRHVAELCRIALTEDEVELMKDQLAELLSEILVIQSIDTDQIEPTGHASNVDNVTREDEISQTLTVDQVLQNAPQSEGSFIRIRRVLEG